MQNLSTPYDISLEPLCKAHLTQLAAHLRAEDRAELWACYRVPTQEGLEKCVARSFVSVAFLYKGKVCAIAGLEPASLLGQAACVWSWTGTEVLHCQKSFWRISNQVLAVFKKYYPHLYAACDVRYKTALRYLEHLGGKRMRGMIYLAGRETKFALYQWQ